MFSTSVCIKHKECQGCTLLLCCPVSAGAKLFIVEETHRASRLGKEIFQPWASREMLGLRNRQSKYPGY